MEHNASCSKKSVDHQRVTLFGIFFHLAMLSASTYGTNLGCTISKATFFSLIKW